MLKQIESEPVGTVQQAQGWTGQSPNSAAFPATEWSLFLVFVGGVVGWYFWRHHRETATVRHPLPSASTPQSSTQLEPPEHSVWLAETVQFSQPMQWLGYAKDLERSPQPEIALTIYAEALCRYPQDARLWHAQGLALARFQRFEAALQSYDRAYAMTPHNRELAHERGDTLLELGQFEAAIASFDRYLRYDPNSAHVLTDRGYALYRLGRYPEALQLFNKILKQEPRDRDSLQRAAHYQTAILRALEEL